MHIYAYMHALQSARPGRRRASYRARDIGSARDTSKEEDACTWRISSVHCASYIAVVIKLSLTTNESRLHVDCSQLKVVHRKEPFGVDRRSVCEYLRSRLDVVPLRLGIQTD